MKIKIIILSILFLTVGISEMAMAQKKSKKEVPVITLSSKVVDDQGRPIANARIFTNEGKVVTQTNALGKFSVKAEKIEMVLVEADGYNSVVVAANGITPEGITLQGYKYQLGDKDRVDMPFIQMKQRNIVGAVNSINLDRKRETYYEGDDWWSYLQSSGMGIFAAGNIRYASNVIVIDGMMKGDGGLSLAEYITADDIQEITVLKDASSRMLYGGTGEGVINIKTKRGSQFKNYVNVRYEYSLVSPKEMPSYLNAADYMTLYNEARKNDGLSSRYDDLTIQSTRIGFDPVQYPDVDFYSDEFLRNVKQSHRANVEVGGGNKVATYHLNLGWNNGQSLQKLGEASKQGSNTFRARGNVDVKITDYLKAKVDMAVVINSGYSAKGDYWGMASSRRPNQFPFLIPIDRIRPEDMALVEEARQQKSVIDDKYLVAGDQVYTDNLYADNILAGYNKSTNRMANVNIGFDLDLKGITKGLSFSTYGGFDNNNSYIISQNNKYAVYTPSFILNTNGDVDQIAITKHGENNFVGSQGISGVYMNRKMAWFNVLSYSRKFNEIHDVNIAATHRMSSFITQGQIYPNKRLDYAVRANYMYKDKYIIEASAAAIASPFLPAKSRWGVSQSYAAGWIISEEGFFKSKSIDFLKVKASFANLKSDPNSFNLSRDTYKVGSKYSYNDGSSNNNELAVTLGNPDLTFANVYELNVGVEMALLNRSLYGEVNYFNRRKTGVIETPVNNYMGVIGGGDFILSENYGITAGHGFEIGLTYNKRFNRDWSISTNAGVVYYTADNIKIDELNYGEGLEYRQKAGKSLSSMWGYVADGFYTQQEIDLINDAGDRSIAKPSFGKVQAGDVKYVDQNADMIINDQDQKVIGNSRISYDYHLSLEVNYKNFSLYTQFRAQTGPSQFFTNDYYQVYGERKYPSYIMDSRWAYDPELGVDTRQTATYPRLSTTGNEHNFKNSTFWIAKTDFFKIPILQITYKLSQKVANKMAMKSPNIYFRANNILTLGANRDKMMLNVAAEPQSTWYSLGFKANF